MQSRNRVPSRTRKSKGDLLDQKWLTYLLVLILIALIGVFAVSLRYQEAVVRYAKEFIQRAKDALSASLGLKGMLGGFESQSFIKRIRSYQEYVGETEFFLQNSVSKSLFALSFDMSQRIKFSSVALSTRLCNFSPINSCLYSLTTLESKSMVFQ